ncbi:FKBP-type peptidyl-prolyl cis-trans isomerase domain protein [Acididesulfobacillus acetoxydans]|uniref:Trigger factor n=1 Tax=Acididesulfobacillus acetoxydans TaxID=1561005 RepID=A0A8S0Y1G2_9FIRM|nr:trigger factor [Acididesulfobacillus acetoxydans]CAA7599455.1 FKBP-type peptidyl-prolyl cis-trans isomerase domain protein [Acididesulfobacillus acetoxydans]CEJ06740.1 Trigger factor 1 [Acididesulfobacillus acetoxydans]
MSVKVEKLEKNVVVLEVTVEGAKFAQEVNRVAKTFANRVNIPGFRKGKAPRALVEKHVGKETLYNEALDHLLGPTYAEAVKESGITPVDRPEVDVVQVEDGKELIYKAKVTVTPEVELGAYKGLQVEKEAAVVDESAVEAELKRRQDQYAKVITLEGGKAEEGDTVNIDYEGFIGGVPFEGGKAEGHDLVLGSDSFVPGFEKQLVGAETGQEIEVNVHFPEEYRSKELAGKEALFKVKVNNIKRKQVSPLDDEFAKDVSEFGSLDELKADIRRKLLEGEERRVETAYRNAIVAKAVENASVEIPDVMIQAQVDHMVEDLAHNLEYQGINLEQYYQYSGSNEQEMRERFRPQAAENVKSELTLEAIGKAEGISISDDELNEKLVQLAEQYHQPADALRANLEANGGLEGFKANLTMDKVVEFLVENNA